MITVDEQVETLRQTLGEIELGVLTEGYTLAQAMREGCQVSSQLTSGWIRNGQACALGAAFLGAKARGYVN